VPVELPLDRSLRPEDFMILDDYPQPRLPRLWPAFALVLQPSILPYDSVTLIWELEEGGRWRITKMFGAVS
jgi:hypothetical protein